MMLSIKTPGSPYLQLKLHIQAQISSGREDVSGLLIVE
jgi:hypothetical protein